MSINRRISETVRYWLLAKQNSSRYQRSNVTTMLEPAFSLSLSLSLSVCLWVWLFVTVCPSVNRISQKLADEISTKFPSG